MKSQVQKDSENFEPFISADRVLPEFTKTSVIIGILMSILFGAANAYLGLQVGMTISASIPAAVISMGIIRVLLGKESILENNMVQTIGSAGESLAAGAIFTLPAMYIWLNEWGMGAPNYFTIASIALVGGALGVFFMVPLRKALIVNEHGTLPYPEGTACAEVLLAGEEGGEKAKITFTGLGIGALYKFISDGFKMFSGSVETEIKGFDGAMIGMDLKPALLGVGFIIGKDIAGYMIAGALIGWAGIIPLIAKLGSIAEITMYPASVPISELGPWGIWDNYIRYIGAGAVAFGGMFSLIKSLPLIIKTFKDAIGDYGSGSGSKNVRTNQDLSMKVVLIGSLVIILIMAMLPIIPVGFGGALLIAIFGFFFATVSSRIVGLVGSSSNPVSGMTIATLVVTAMLFKLTGNDGQAGMLGTLTVGSIICIIAAMAGDTSQDLKTGFLVGATPKKQQYGEMIGAVASALAIGGVLTLLSTTYGFGSDMLPAPQATLMRLVVEGVMGGSLPWNLIFIGVGIGVAIEFLGLPVLPIAIGLYLPIHLSTPIVAGGIIRGILDKKKEKLNDSSIKQKIEKGILYSSGLIAGEGIIGIVLALFVYFGIDKYINFGINFGAIGGIIAFGLLIFGLLKNSVFSKSA
ncbi:MAG: OPT family oligopeptide transporter [Bacillota bacterium]